MRLSYKSQIITISEWIEGPTDTTTHRQPPQPPPLLILPATKNFVVRYFVLISCASIYSSSESFLHLPALLTYYPVLSLLLVRGNRKCNHF